MTNPNAKLSEEEKPICLTCNEPIYQREEFGDKAWCHMIGGAIMSNGHVAEPKLKPKVNPCLRTEEGMKVTLVNPTMYTDPNNADHLSFTPFPNQSAEEGEVKSPRLQCQHGVPAGFLCHQCSPVEWNLNQSDEGKPTESAQQDDAQNLRYATQIASSLHRNFYPEVTQWKPLAGDLFGVLMQIDNMVIGLQRKANEEKQFKETTTVTVPGEQKGNMPCAHEFVAVDAGPYSDDIFYSVCKKCGQPESEVEQRGDVPQPVDPNEVVTKRNQLEAQPLPAAMTIDEIVTSLYRRFKDWSKRGFGPDDVTWCEVKADILQLLAQSKPVESTGESPEDAWKRGQQVMREYLATAFDSSIDFASPLGSLNNCPLFPYVRPISNTEEK